MITLSIDISEDQAQAMIESIDDALEDGETWEPEFLFEEENAESIRQNLRFQLNHSDKYYEDL